MNKIKVEEHTLDEILNALVEKLEGGKTYKTSSINIKSGASPIKQFKKWEITYTLKERK